MSRTSFPAGILKSHAQAGKRGSPAGPGPPRRAQIVLSGGLKRYNAVQTRDNFGAVGKVTKWLISRGI